MPKESDAKWYVLHTYSGYENNVASNIAKLVENRGLHEYIYETQIPLELVSDDPSDFVDEEAESKNDDLEILREMGLVDESDDEEDELELELNKRKKAKKSRAEEQKLLPSYVLIKMVMNDATRHIIRNIRGVTGFVGPDSQPVPLTDEEVVTLGVGKIAKKTFEVDYEVGDSVIVCSGQFAGDSVIVKSIDSETGIVTVEMLIGGNMSTVEFEASALERE